MSARTSSRRSARSSASPRYCWTRRHAMASSGLCRSRADPQGRPRAQRLVDGLLDPPLPRRPRRRRQRRGIPQPAAPRPAHALNAIKGYGEMLLEDVVAAEAAAFVRDLEKLLAAASVCWHASIRRSTLPSLARSRRRTRPSAPGRSLDRLSHLIRPVPAERGPATAIESAASSSSTTTSPTAICSPGTWRAMAMRSLPPKTAEQD